MSAPITNWIAQALTPGVALTATIFYNSSLQNRFVYITGRIRELNREARALGEAPEKNAERLKSLRWQVDLMSRRSLTIRRSVLTVYVSFLSFIFTSLALAIAGWQEVKFLETVAPFTFGIGLICLGIAGTLSISEMYLAQRTVTEDIKTSYRG